MQIYQISFAFVLTALVGFLLWLVVQDTTSKATNAAPPIINKLS